MYDPLVAQSFCLQVQVEDGTVDSVNKTMLVLHQNQRLMSCHVMSCMLQCVMMWRYKSWVAKDRNIICN